MLLHGFHASLCGGLRCEGPTVLGRTPYPTRKSIKTQAPPPRKGFYPWAGREVATRKGCPKAVT